MDWHYAKGDKKVGPIKEEEFFALVKNGTITPKTLVWHSGLSNWREYGALDADGQSMPEAIEGIAAGKGVCSECGRPFPPEDMIKHGDSMICEDCKPVFLQKLKQGTWSDGTYRYGGFWIRAGAKIIDGLIQWVLQMAITTPLALLSSTSGSDGMPGIGSILGSLLGMAMGIALPTFFLGKFGATLGKMACGLKVIVADGSRITYLGALGRSFAEILSSLILLIGYIMAASDSEKRTLHDRICNTRVVRK